MSLNNLEYGTQRKFWKLPFQHIHWFIGTIVDPTWFMWDTPLELCPLKQVFVLHGWLLPSWLQGGLEALQLSDYVGVMQPSHRMDCGTYARKI